MKNTLLAFFILMSSSALLLSCRKESVSKQAGQTIYQTTQMNGYYELVLGSFGDEEGAGIVTQAKHFSVSNLNRGTDVTTYKYVPEANFVGTDEVTIASAKGSDGASANHQIVYTTIKFTIIK